MSEDLSAFIEFIENELDLDDDEWPPSIPNVDRKSQVAYTSPQIIDDRTFLLFCIGSALLGLLLLISPSG